MSGTLNGYVISFGRRCESLWMRCFLGPIYVAGRLLLSVNDGSCEGASGKCDSKYGCSFSCSISHQLLRPCCSLSVSMSVVEVTVSLAMVMLNAAQVCATLATATADGGKQW